MRGCPQTAQHGTQLLIEIAVVCIRVSDRSSTECGAQHTAEASRDCRLAHSSADSSSNIQTQKQHTTRCAPSSSSSSRKDEKAALAPSPPRRPARKRWYSASSSRAARPSNWSSTCNVWGVGTAAEIVWRWRVGSKKVGRDRPPPRDALRL